MEWQWVAEYEHGGQRYMTGRDFEAVMKSVKRGDTWVKMESGTWVNTANMTEIREVR